MTALSALLFTLVAHAHPSTLYTGRSSQEGVLTFSASVDLESYSKPTEDDARAQILKQYFYMLGNLRYGVHGHAATPSKGYELSNLSIKPQGSHTYRISYSSKMNIAVDKTQSSGDLKFDLPRNPVDIADLDNSCSRDKWEPNWYGFDPHLNGCPLVENDDYTTVTGHLEVHANTTESYPEYDKLIGADGVIHMSVLMNSEITKPDGLIEKLSNLGFNRHTWSAHEIEAFLGFTPRGRVQIEDFTKTTGVHPLKVMLFYGNANINSKKSKAFHFFYKDALEHSNIVIYSGHSGLSRNVDLSLIEEKENFKIALPETYQLYMLAGCITYGYYVDAYLARKATVQDPRGTRHLDVMTFGMSAPGYDDHPLFKLSEAILAFAETGARSSYQSITNQVTYSWFAVVGDEDNE